MVTSKTFGGLILAEVVLFPRAIALLKTWLPLRHLVGFGRGCFISQGYSSSKDMVTSKTFGGFWEELFYCPGL